MKYRLNILILLIIIFAFSTSLVLATEEHYITVFLKNGSEISGELVEENEDGSVMIKKNDGYVITLDEDKIYYREFYNISTTGSVGIGLGIPYGLFGINGEYALTENISLSGGIGVIGFNVGGMYYFTGPKSTWRPRISAYVGKNAISIVDEFVSYNGLTLGLGQKWMWGKTKKHGLDLDIMYIINPALDRAYEYYEEYSEYYYVNKPGKIKISFGYRYGF